MAPTAIVQDPSFRLYQGHVTDGLHCSLRLFLRSSFSSFSSFHSFQTCTVVLNLPLTPTFSPLSFAGASFSESFLQLVVFWHLPSGDSYLHALPSILQSHQHFLPNTQSNTLTFLFCVFSISGRLRKVKYVMCGFCGLVYLYSQFIICL